jgi:hypothetical protein
MDGNRYAVHRDDSGGLEGSRRSERGPYDRFKPVKGARGLPSARCAWPFEGLGSPSEQALAGQLRALYGRLPSLTLIQMEKVRTQFLSLRQ